MLSLKNLTNNKIIAHNVIEADSFFKRLKGLMFTKVLSPQSGMFIHPCNGIHTFFMNYVIDVLYLDPNNKIIAIDEKMKPSRFGKIHKKAVAVVELSEGMIEETQTKVGHVVEFI
ncbi:DUF192 domain-containing protein [Clostridium grantii]|uniref:DUF192 domain-containing protein n=1 Tax=Clostridium grantii DSM 8605 TaxID=1121316 RepID=A0A1M5X6B0_9CLOT|nr:DUF192 domain-containing protein [Clostridium grantii]SHH95329.1 hypothetical protein SAMN02745207_03385 [Clostridium grantii DSM 8605]